MTITTNKVSRRALVGGATAVGAAWATTPSVFADPGPRRAPAVLQESVTIPLFTVENDPNTLAFYENTLAQYKEQVDPNVELEISIYQDENILQFLTTAFETGTDLGIFAVPAAQVPVWAQQGYLLPITSIVQNIGEDDFLPGTRFVEGGEDYALTVQSNASSLWVRQDLLEAEGLAPPTTYDEFVGALQALHGKDGLVGIATGVGTVPGLTLQYFAPYLYQSGREYFDAQGNLTFDQPEVLEAINRFTQVLQYTTPSLYNATYPDLLNLFSAGRAVFGTFPGRMGVNVAERAPDIAANVTVVPPPAGPFMTGQLLFGGTQAFAIFAETANPDQTKSFFEFMTTGERALEYAMTVPGHLLPALYSVRELIPTYESEFMTNYGDWVIAMSEWVPNAFTPALSMGSVANGEYLGRLSNINPWASQIWDTDPVDGRMFQEILINGTDPEQAWTSAADELRQISDTWKAENPDWTPPPIATPAP